MTLEQIRRDAASGRSVWYIGSQSRPVEGRVLEIVNDRLVCVEPYNGRHVRRIFRLEALYESWASCQGFILGLEGTPGISWTPSGRKRARVAAQGRTPMTPDLLTAIVDEWPCNVANRQNRE